MDTHPDKDKLTSGYLTHELRAPLASVRFALELFMDKHAAALAPEDRHLLDIALRNTARLNLLIDDIMELSKIQTGRLSTHPEPLDPAQLARETAADMDAWAQSSGVKLTVAAAGGCPPVLADRRRTAQALTNLISNALKFTPRDGSITVAVAADEKRPGFVLFSVKDTGCGIPPQDQKRIFGYFVQLGPEEKRREGTGLGLPLARSMVEIQGGLMWVESRPGEGTTFKFTLPVYVPPAAVPEIRP